MTFGLAFLNVVVHRAMMDAPSELSGWPTWFALLGDWSTWRWRLFDMGVLAVLPVLIIAVGALLRCAAHASDRERSWHGGEGVDQTLRCRAIHASTSPASQTLPCASSATGVGSHFARSAGIPAAG